jgi:cAMP-dependent protein kinase regulator
MNFSIPEGLTDLLQDFTVEILRNRPKDLVLFGAQYFNNLLEKRELDVETGTETESVAAPSRIQSAQTNHDDEDDDIGEMPDLPKMGRFGGRRHSVAAEKYNPEEDTDDSPKVVHEKTETERNYLLETIKNIFMFRSLDNKQIDDLLDAMFGRTVNENDVIIEQGDDGDNFYVIESGVYDIYVNNEKVGSYNNKGSFGELALMYNMPRAATIKASTSGRLWALDRQTFKRIVLKSAFEKRKMYEQLLENMPIFKSLNPYQRMSVADALYSKTYKDNEEIIKQGEQATCMYFIENGSVKILRTQNGESKELKVCNKGEYFGELALLTKKPRAATVIASGVDVKCAILDIDAFERLLGPCLEIMKNNIPNYEGVLKNLFGEKFSISDLK